MRSYIATVGVALIIVAGLARERRVSAAGPGQKELRRGDSGGAGVGQDCGRAEFLGTLVRTCLLPQSGGENTTDNVPGYVTNPASAPARNIWYAEPAKVFDNLYFVGGKLHSAWALTTREG